MTSPAREQTALGWLGIDVYIPSGRVRRPVPASPVPEVMDAGAESREAGAEAASESVAEVPAASLESIPPDQVVVSGDSPHGALARAIARWGRLECREEADGGDAVWLRGQRWALADVAVDGDAKRRLWKALAAGPRRAGRS